MPISHPSITSLSQAIRATLAYFDILNFPLTLEEITKYLYGWSALQETVEQELRRMPEISHLHGYYFLRGRSELAELRKKRKKIEAALWRKVNRWRFLFACCPFVRTVAVCNSLSYGNVKETSDIDLFVVTANDRLATARFFMKFLTQIFGIRAHHEKIAGRFCLSFFVTEKASDLSLLALPFDPHLAYFVRTMKPVIGAASVYLYFQRTVEFFLNIFGSKIEEKCSAWLSKREDIHHQKFAHSNGIVRNRDVFKFHENDPRQKIADQFRDLLNSNFTGVPKNP